jgi:hypothetical protein
VHIGSFSSLAFRPWGDLNDEIVVGTEDGTAHRFNAWTAEHVRWAGGRVGADRGVQMGFWDFSELSQTDSEHGYVSSMQFAGAGLLTQSPQGSCVVWRSVTRDDLSPALRLEGVSSALMDQSGGWLVAALGENRVGLYDVARGPEPFATLRCVRGREPAPD